MRVGPPSRVHRSRRAAVLWTLVPSLFLLALASVHAMARRETNLTSEHAAAARLVTYVVEPGGRLRFRVPQGTEVLRFVVHAFARGRFDGRPHAMKWRIPAQGAPDDGTEVFDAVAPGTARRALPEDPGVVVFDPLAFNVDVRGRTSPDFVLALDSISGADGVVVRAYRREGLDVTEAVLRGADVGRSRRSHLARRAGQLDWVDLAETDRSTLIGARWQKLAPIPDDGKPLASLVLSLEPPRDPGRMPASATVASAPSNPEETKAAEPFRFAEFYRASPTRPVIVDAGIAPLVLEVSARRPLTHPDVASVASDVTVVTAMGSRSTTATVDRLLRRAPADGYAGDATGVGVSEPATFHVLVPTRGRVAILPSEGFIDVSLGELDPDAIRDEAPAERDDTPRPRAFFPRRPTNLEAFAPDACGLLRLGPAGERPHPANDLPLLRVARPEGAVLRRGGRRYVGRSVHFMLNITGEAAHALPVRLLASEDTDVTITVDGNRPRRRDSGLVEFVTIAHRVRARDDGRAFLVLGDDLAPGDHTLAFTPARGTLWVHLPWARRGSAGATARWVSGNFEP